MSEPLFTYLNDHLGGAQIALHSLEAMRDQHEEEHFRLFAAELLPEIQADDELLRTVIRHVGAEPNPVKQAGGWLAEKLARIKLGHTGSSSMEMFEALEVLSLGVLGKRALWRALHAASLRDARLRAFDFEAAAARAEAQHQALERERLRLAGFVLSPSAE